MIDPEALGEIAAFLNLTRRELQVAVHLLAYRSRKETARLLGISRKTADTYYAGLYRKLKVRNAQAALGRLFEFNRFLQERGS
jgi:DNA-binding CsgD family transcriptional regulator